MAAIPRPPPLTIPPEEPGMEEFRLPVPLQRASNRGWFTEREIFPEVVQPRLIVHISELFERSIDPEVSIMERWTQAVHHYGRLAGMLQNPSERNMERFKLATSYFRMLTETNTSPQAAREALSGTGIPPPNRRILEQVFRCLSTISRMFYGDEMAARMTHPEPRQTSVVSRAYDILSELVRDRASPEEIQAAANLYALVSRHRQERR